jgi:hypothetical protein
MVLVAAAALLSWRLPRIEPPTAAAVAPRPAQ